MKHFTCIKVTHKNYGQSERRREKRKENSRYMHCFLIEIYRKVVEEVRDKKDEIVNFIVKIFFANFKIILVLITLNYEVSCFNGVK